MKKYLSDLIFVNATIAVRRDIWAFMLYTLLNSNMLSYKDMFLPLWSHFIISNLNFLICLSFVFFASVREWKRKGQSVSKANILHLFHLFQFCSLYRCVCACVLFVRKCRHRACNFNLVYTMWHWCWLLSVLCILDNAKDAYSPYTTHIYSIHNTERIVINEKNKLVKHKDL